MIIRSAKIVDTEKIALTHSASITVLCSEYYPPENIAGWVEVLSPDIYENAIKEKVMIVAEDEDEILGLGILDLERKQIGAIYIHPKVKGRGIGRRLLLKLEEIASKNETDQLTLCATINAYGFYKHQSYTGAKKMLHELPNGVGLECIQMHKTFNKTDKPAIDV
ncbi:N-acetyltransferase [Desulfosarcina widdelii]|uniref:N-acetyltransferase n=1 Tax=Desulfosarcina widdelii TaxID=947919 RepID=A0A5K7ZEE3_9BACT|nr:GNAT family N-acetyltransferase [Desulfosarcina widdelii]BBO79190.1 N-acetyltransferase [Desulfosarcina widdelii]